MFGGAAGTTQLTKITYHPNSHLNIALNRNVDPTFTKKTLSNNVLVLYIG